MAKINICKLAVDTNELVGEYFNCGHRKTVIVNEQFETCRLEKRDETRKQNSKRNFKKISKKCRERKVENEKILNEIFDESEKELSLMSEAIFSL